MFRQAKVQSKKEVAGASPRKKPVRKTLASLLEKTTKNDKTAITKPTARGRKGSFTKEEMLKKPRQTRSRRSSATSESGREELKAQIVTKQRNSGKSRKLYSAEDELYLNSVEETSSEVKRRNSISPINGCLNFSAINESGFVDEITDENSRNKEPTTPNSPKNVKNSTMGENQDSVQKRFSNAVQSSNSVTEPLKVDESPSILKPEHKTLESAVNLVDVEVADVDVHGEGAKLIFSGDEYPTSDTKVNLETESSLNTSPQRSCKLEEWYTNEEMKSPSFVCLNNKNRESRSPQLKSTYFWVNLGKRTVRRSTSPPHTKLSSKDEKIGKTITGRKFMTDEVAKQQLTQSVVQSPMHRQEKHPLKTIAEDLVSLERKTNKKKTRSASSLTEESVPVETVAQTNLVEEFPQKLNSPVSEKMELQKSTLDDSFCIVFCEKVTEKTHSSEYDQSTVLTLAEELHTKSESGVLHESSDDDGFETFSGVKLTEKTLNPEYDQSTVLASFMLTPQCVSNVSTRIKKREALPNKERSQDSYIFEESKLDTSREDTKNFKLREVSSDSDVFIFDVQEEFGDDETIKTGCCFEETQRGAEQVDESSRTCNFEDRSTFTFSKKFDVGESDDEPSVLSSRKKSHTDLELVEGKKEIIYSVSSTDIEISSGDTSENESTSSRDIECSNNSNYEENDFFDVEVVAKTNGLEDEIGKMRNATPVEEKNYKITINIFFEEVKPCTEDPNTYPINSNATAAEQQKQLASVTVPVDINIGVTKETDITEQVLDLAKNLQEIIKKSKSNELTHTLIKNKVSLDNSMKERNRGFRRSRRSISVSEQNFDVWSVTYVRNTLEHSVKPSTVVNNSLWSVEEVDDDITPSISLGLCKKTEQIQQRRLQESDVKRKKLEKRNVFNLNSAFINF